MGLIKRAIKRASHKLAKIIAPVQTHQLVLNPPLQTADLASIHHHEHLSSEQMRKMRKLSSKTAASLHKKFRKSNSSKDTAVADALLLAVKNYLPPLQFHHIHGPHAQLSQNKRIARRTQSFCQALVFSNRVILPNERVYIKVLEISKCWSGTIRFGFTAVDPATLACKMPKHACPDMTNAGHTWARALADEVVRRNSVIHFSYSNNGIIHYGINNQDCGIFHANVGTNQNLWFLVDIYGLTAAVELIDPRVNNNAVTSAGGLGHFDHIDGELLLESSHDRSSTMFKSTSAMDELFGRHGRTSSSSAGTGNGSGSSRLRKKQLRKHARQLALIQGNWPLENYSGANFHSLHLAQQHQQQQQQLNGAMQLPNLNSITLPSVQQNIYSPMPNPAVVDGARHRHHSRPADMHDYQQILSSTYGSALYQPSRGPKLTNSISMANISHIPRSVQATTSGSSSSNNNSIDRHPEHRMASINQVDISDQLEQMHLHDKRPRLQQQQQQSTPSSSSASKSSKSSSSVVVASQQTPVAATRKRPQHINLAQTNLKRAPETVRDRHDKSTPARIVFSRRSHASPASSSSSMATVTATGTATKQQPATSSASHVNSHANVKPKIRHSIKNQKSASANDSNNNNGTPPSKDCPICFERPINCVLYQCGHMCTCYECGVKQWKTQSRTCPICRTIIKDVIKTYLS